MLFITQICYAENKSQSPNEIYNKILNLIEKKSFSQADLILRENLVSKKLTDDGFRTSEKLYKKFSSLNDEDLLNEWCNANTNSHFSFSIRGNYYLRKASESRGNELARKVTEKQWQDMKKFLALAQADFEKSYELEPQDPYSASEMITVCLLKGYPREVMENWFSRAIQADNYWLTPYYGKMYYLAPQWFGKENEYQDFWKKCFYDSPKGSAVFSIVFDVLTSRVVPSMFIVKARGIGNGNIDQETLSIIQKGVQRLKVDFPKSSLPAYYEALLSIRENNYQQALTSIESLVKNNPSEEKYIEAKISLLFILNKEDSAEKELNILLTLNKKSKFALANLGSLKIDKYNDIDGGINNFIKIIEQKSDNSHKSFYYYTIGNILFFKEKYNIAIDNYTKSLSLDQEYSLSRYQRANAKYKIGDIDGAIEDMLILKEDKKYRKASIEFLDKYMSKKTEKITQKNINEELTSQADEKQSDQIVDFQSERKKTIKQSLDENSLYNLKDCEGFYYRKMKEKARDCVASLLNRDPENGSLYFLAGQIAENLEYNFDSSSNYYGAAVSKNPENEKYILIFGKSLFMQQRYDMAITVLSKLIDMNSSVGEAYYYRGLSLESIGNREKAIEDMQLSAIYGPMIEESRIFVEKYGMREQQIHNIDKLEQLEILANDNLQLGQIEKAEKQFNEILSLDPKHNRSWYQLGEIYFSRGDKEQARRCFTRAIELNNENDEYLSRRGFLLRKMNKFDLAIKDYSNAIHIKPKGYHYIERARCYKELKEYKKAENDLITSLKNTDGSSTSAFIELGEVLTKTGTKMKFNNENKKILLYRAGEYFNQGKFDLSKNDYEAFIKIDPNNDEVYDKLGTLLFEKMKNTDAGILNLNKAIDKNNNKSIYYIKRGKMYLAKNDFNKAKDDFSKSIDLEPINGMNFLHRGNCYAKLGQKDLALNDYKKAKEVTPSLFQHVQPEDMLK